MKIPNEIINKYYMNDMDTFVVAHLFDESIGRVLEVGAHDEPVANMLSDMGHQVVGIDLREYDITQPKCNYRYVRGDLCSGHAIMEELLMDGFYDSVFSISAIEHFGLNAYSEGKIHQFYDIIAMRKIWEMLKPGGTAYISIPYGGNHLDVVPHWRVYNRESLVSRIVQDFSVEGFWVFISGSLEINGKHRNQGDFITMDEADNYSGNPPHISALLKLRKSVIKRIAPDGR